MSDYGPQYPPYRQVSAMSSHSPRDITRRSNGSFNPAVVSQARDTRTASSPANEQIRRKPVPADRPWQSLHTEQNSPEGDAETTYPGTYEPYIINAPTFSSNINNQPGFSEHGLQSNRNTHMDFVNKVPNLESQRARPGSLHIFPDYDNAEFVQDSNYDGLYNYSSTTVASTQPIIPGPLNPQRASAVRTPPPPPPTPPSPLQHRRSSASPSRVQEISLIATICLAHFLTQAGLAQSIAPLPIIAGGLAAADPSRPPAPAWYSAAYSLTVGTFILPSGRLGDVYGPKRLFVAGWLWFALASLAAGFNPRIAEDAAAAAAADSVLNRVAGGGGASGEVFFCFCRALQGIGPAVLMPNGLAILGRSYEDGAKKNMAFALFGASAPVGFVIGSVMSSLLAERTHWSWAYWGLAIACGVMAVVSLSVVPSLPGTVDSAGEDDDRLDDGRVAGVPMWKQLDVPGIIFGVSGLVLINVALNQAPIVSWSTPYTYFLLIIGLIILSFFFFIEFTPFLTPHPLIPLAALSVDTCFVLGCIACGWATFGIWIFYLWEFLEILRGLSPLLASAQFSPAAMSGMLAALTTGFLLSKTTPQVIMVLSMFAFFIGTTIIATAPVDQIYWAQAFFSIIIMPWGMDMSFPSATILLSGKVGPENQGVAMSLVNTVVNYSISVGLGLAGTVQSNYDKDGTQVLRGFRSAWYFGMGLSGIGIVVAITFLATSAWKARSALREKQELGKA